tara:strand:- start:622 stop:933 length:312 start_codon:yes stop_codon:yes gene_type:complete
MKIKLDYCHIDNGNEWEEIEKFNKGLKQFGWEITDNQEVIINLSTIKELWEWMDKIDESQQGMKFAKEYGIDCDYTFDNLYLEFYSLLQIITKVREGLLNEDN